MAIKSKSIDLGSLQDTFDKCKTQLQKDAKANLKAQEAFDRSKIAFEQAQQKLRDGSRTVLS